MGSVSEGPGLQGQLCTLHCPVGCGLSARELGALPRVCPARRRWAALSSFAVPGRLPWARGLCKAVGSGVWALSDPLVRSWALGSCVCVCLCVWPVHSGKVHGDHGAARPLSVNSRSPEGGLFPPRQEVRRQQLHGCPRPGVALSSGHPRACSQHHPPASDTGCSLLTLTPESAQTPWAQGLPLFDSRQEHWVPRGPAVCLLQSQGFPHPPIQ